VENRTQNTPGGEGSIDIQADDEVGLGGVQALEEELRGRLGICVGCQWSDYMERFVTAVGPARGIYSPG
jgi:hypothetical protein